MPAYSYEAIDAEGADARGVLNADSAHAARAQLRERGLIPLAVAPAAPSAAQTRFSRRHLGREELAVWTRQLAGLVSAGLTLERALATLEPEMERAPQRALVAQLRADVSAGHSFADALAQHPREFPAVYRAVVAAGEQGGALGSVLERLADDLEQQQLLRGKLVSAAIYPALVSAIALVIVVFLLTYVVPQMAAVFAGSRRALPLITRIMLAMSALVRDWGWLIALALAAAGAAAHRALAQPALRRRFDAAWLDLPVIGRLARGYNAARFAATLALLVQAGLPIVRALQAASETLGNQALADDARAALRLVREGAPIATALDMHRRFPPLLIMFIRLGEQTGDLAALLGRAAAQLSTEAQRRALQFAAIAEPLLIAAMGGIVMFIVLAVLMPIIEINQLVH